jgi:hypothetical protein
MRDVGGCIFVTTTRVPLCRCRADASEGVSIEGGRFITLLRVDQPLQQALDLSQHRDRTID